MPFELTRLSVYLVTYNANAKVNSVHFIKFLRVWRDGDSSEYESRLGFEPGKERRRRVKDRAVADGSG